MTHDPAQVLPLTIASGDFVGFIGCSESRTRVSLAFWSNAVLCETYNFLFTLAAKGVSVSLLMRLRSRPMTAGELMKSYSTRAMVERRIDQLRAGGFLMETEGQIRLFDRGRVLVREFGIVRGFFNPRSLL